MNTHTHLLLKTDPALKPANKPMPRWRAWALGVLSTAAMCGAQAGVNLPDQPVFSSTGVPGNLALALSVEFPTAISVAHIDGTYVAAKTFLGYFDPNKCYRYKYDEEEKKRHFYPNGDAPTRVCTGKWSGNFLNWATMQTVDPFRWALTGGYRVKDMATETWLEKAYASNQGGDGNFPNKSLLDDTLVKNNTPFGWSSFNMRVKSLGNKMRFTRTGDLYGDIVPYGKDGDVASNKVYEVSVRVKVCDTSEGAGALEGNCTAYSSGAYKPTGLLQTYSDKIRYSAFGYLNDDDILRDGGVLRARQKFVGPLTPKVNGPAVVNSAAEWDANTGIMAKNPDDADATTTTALVGDNVDKIINSGVINYLNKFGEINPENGYKTYDPVGELYYAAIRYYKNLGNVPEWSKMDGASVDTKKRWADGFPVITSWDDPIQYSCQRNFILGIGDVNTHADKNVPGATGSANEPTKPAAVAADTSLDAVVATNKVGSLEGLGASLGTVENYGGCCNNNSALMAGLAYDAHTKDIRPDDGTKKNKGMQTISTYWLDILEYSTYKANNQFYLAAKYGGFKVPDGYSTYGQTDPLPDKWWWTTTELTVGGQKRPDNYYVASQPDQMVTGLQRAFSSIAAQLKSFSTSFSTSAPQIAASGTNSYSAQYDSTTWSGEVAANTTTFGSDSTPQFVEAWKFSDKLAAQIASTDGLGWKNKRRIATFNNTTKKGVPFKLELLDSTQQGQLDTLYRTGNDSADYLNYLRGDPTHEASSSAAGSAKIYRDRAKPLGDIVGSKLRVVGPPSAPFSSATNSGYDAYKTAQKDRQTMLYVGSNDGMLHAINGSTKTGDDAAGTEVFAYVPGSLYAGPSSSPTVNGLQTRGDPDFTHRYFVDGNPATFDIDFGNTAGGSGTSDWRTILVGGLGKGGKSYYAIDISNPAAMDSETVVADKVLWEFSNTTPDVDGKLGFTFGEPIAVKTKKYKWVLVFGSGYNNSDGKGYIFIVNPRTGALLETIATGAGTTTEEAGLAHVQAYVPERTDNTAETLYAGDLLGNLWRVDVTGEPTSYPAAVQFAKLTNGDNQAVPVTSRPLAVIQPYTNTRWVVVGTGRLLSETDKFSNQSQAFFAFRDGTNLRPNSDTQLPATMSFPLKRTNLRTLTDLKTPVILNLATEIGWWVDLGATAGLGWRVISDPSSFYGEVSFSTMVPTIADECSPAGIGRIYTIDLGTGKTKLLNDSGAAITYAEGFDGAVTDLRNLSVGGKRVLVYGTDQGKKGKIKLEPPTPIPAKRLNWRELLLAD